MDVTRWKQIDQLLDAALEQEPASRVDFVTLEAGKDKDLRDRVLQLLSAGTKSERFLHSSAIGAAAKALADAETEVSAFAFLNKRISKYSVTQLIGAGGMGEVYLAFDEKLNRKVALKILPS